MTTLTRRQMVVAGGASALAFSLPVLAQQSPASAPVPGGASALAPGAARTSFRPGALWLDTAGKPIQAHGGSIVQVGELFYWYGENKERSVKGSKVWTWGV
ncbi:MAG: hypothetical protein ABIQ81_06105, partial [Novosphingobium sp.]